MSDMSPADTPEGQAPKKRRSPWIWVSLVLALIAAGLLIWALTTQSDLDNSQQEADELQSQLDQGKAAGTAALAEGPSRPSSAPSRGPCRSPSTWSTSRCSPTSRASSPASSSRLWNGLPGGKVRRFGVVTTSRPPGRSTRAHSRTNWSWSHRCSTTWLATTRPAQPSASGRARGSRAPVVLRGRSGRRGAGTAGPGRARRPVRPRRRPAAGRRTPRRSRPRPPPRRGPAATSPPIGTRQGVAGTSSSRARSPAPCAHRSAPTRRDRSSTTGAGGSRRAAGRPANHEPRGQAWMASVTSARRSAS